ncbi:hypothetical protein KIP69_02860 [Geobacter sulfurreducens]|nr:hypothetical protein [Geobacter sulfurreducens]AJY70319.1 hypothetical protein RW64_12390 [Geobacter sulfurreducens]QVW35811.1 hypothetical protein KIP69_02860 [Geobacter sulfurreducens]
MKSKWKKILLWSGGFVLAAIAVAKVVDINERPKRVASILNIPSLPKSARVIDCNAAFIPTDVVDTCSIEIDANDFPDLLSGYNFSESPTTETSHSAVFTKVGPEFPLAVEFTAVPKELKHGGHVKVLADRERRRAVIDLYVE